MLDSFNFDNPNLENCLTGLNVNDLLKLKHSINYIPKQNELNFNVNIVSCRQNDDETRCMKSEMLPLMAENREYISPSGYGYGSDNFIEEKPSRVQAIFHVSITALAFLAFGGYLLCLIVQAIKNKGQLMYINAIESTVTPTINTGVKGIKVYKRSRRSTTTTARTRTTRTTTIPIMYSYNDPITLMDPYQYYMRNMNE